MAKFDDLKRLGGENVRESMSVGRPGRGIIPASSGIPDREVGIARDKDARTIEIARIVPDPAQPRKKFDQEELGRLADSIGKHGQLQPILVHWSEGLGRYKILFGERRWRAAQMVGLATMQCRVSERDLTDPERLSIQLIENVLRSDLKPIEQAHAYRDLMAAQQINYRQLADQLSINPGTIAKAIALLELPPEVQERVEQGGISPAAAYQISRLEVPADQVALAGQVEEHKITRDEIVGLVEKIKQKRAGKAPKAPKPDPEVFDVGGGTTVTVNWQVASATTAEQALKEALKACRARRAEPPRAGGQDAA